MAVPLDRQGKDLVQGKGCDRAIPGTQSRLADGAGDGIMMMVVRVLRFRRTELQIARYLNSQGRWRRESLQRVEMMLMGQRDNDKSQQSNQANAGLQAGFPRAGKPRTPVTAMQSTGGAHQEFLAGSIDLNAT